MKAFLLGIVVAIVLGIGSIVVFVSGGNINIAATTRESSILQWFLHSVYEQTVLERSAGVDVPRDLASEALILRGAGDFSRMCSGCHTPPGERPTAVHRGLNPQPPELHELMEERTAAEAYWVIENGVRMTGMPAFGKTHSAEQLWALVAFINDAKNYSGDQYATVVTNALSMNGEHDGHDHRHINDSATKTLQPVDPAPGSAEQPALPEAEPDVEVDDEAIEESDLDHSDHAH